MSYNGIACLSFQLFCRWEVQTPGGCAPLPCAAPLRVPLPIVTLCPAPHRSPFHVPLSLCPSFCPSIRLSLCLPGCLAACSFNDSMEAHRDAYIRAGVFLILERLQMHVYRTLIKRM